MFIWSNTDAIFFKNLIEWINDVLAEKRIVVKSLTEDLNDGQILAMLVGTRSF